MSNPLPNKQGSVIVVGAGIVGICTALSLQEKGFAVTLIDKAPPASGASSGNAGVVSPWSCVPQSMPGIWKHIPKWLFDTDGPLSVRWSYVPKMIPWLRQFIAAGLEQNIAPTADAMNALNRPNVQLYRQHLAGTGHEALLQDSCYVHAYRNTRNLNLNGLGWRLRQDRGVPLQLVTGDELHELEPELSRTYAGAVLIKNQARVTDPAKLGKVLFEKSLALGVQFVSADVQALSQTDTGWQLVTATSEIKSSEIVICAGAWSAKLLKPLGLQLPLEAERGYHLMFTNPGISVNNSIMDVEGKFVVSTMLGGIRCAGTAEFAGLDAPPKFARADLFKHLAKRLLPNLETQDTTPWMGIRPSFPDSLPVIGTVPGYPGLVVAFGHCHYGLGMAPHTGRIVARLLAGEQAEVDLTSYRIDRFN